MFDVQAVSTPENWVPEVGSRVQIARNPFLEPDPPEKNRGLVEAWFWQKIGVINEVVGSRARVTFRRSGTFSLPLSNLVAADFEREHYDEMTEMDHLRSCERALIEVRDYILEHQDTVAARWHGEMMSFPSSIARAVQDRMGQLVALSAQLKALSPSAQNSELDAAKRILNDVMRQAGIERYAGDPEYVVTRTDTGVDLRRKVQYGQEK